MKKSLEGILAVFCLVMLLLYPGLALSGARNGLLLWSNVILPTLLPFMVCVGAVAALGGIPLVTRPFFPVLSGLLGLSRQGSFVFMSGLLCGYPMGAKTTGDFLREGRIGLREGRLLLAISNHPSPMFLLGFVMPRMLSSWGGDASCPLWLVMLSLYLPVIPIGLWAGRVYGVWGTELSSGPGAAAPDRASDFGPAAADHPSGSDPSAANQTSRYGSDSASPPFSFDAHLMSCFETMVKIGGYVMLFSIAAIFIQTLSPLSEKSSCFILGITEITTGIHAVSKSWPSETAGAVLAFITAFGGISGIFQTKSVLKNAGLSIRHYVLWKICHGTLSCGTFILLSQAEALASLLPL